VLFQLSRNTVLAQGCLVILEALSDNPASALRFLSFGSTMVSQQFIKMQEVIEVSINQSVFISNKIKINIF